MRSGIIHTNHAGYEVFTELGAVRRRYTAPMMRTAVVGQASPQQPAPANRTGADCRSCLFSGVFGYPVGAAFPPSWVAGSMFIATDNEAILEEDMVFHLPICLRKPGSSVSVLAKRCVLQRREPSGLLPIHCLLGKFSYSNGEFDLRSWPGNTT